MSSEQPVDSDSGRRAFKPPRRLPRARRRRQLPSLHFESFRESFGYGLARAGCAVGFGLVPSVNARFGDSALALVSAGLGLLLIALAMFLYRMGRPVEWRLLADSTTLIVLVPVLVTASSLEVADARFGGRGSNFLAAAAAVACLYVIVAVIATRAGADRDARGQIGVLPAAFSVVAVLMGTTFFSAGAIWRGFAVAWMAAAVVTVVARFVPERRRMLVAPLAFAVFAGAIVIGDSTSENGAALSSGTSAVAALTSVFVAVVLLAIPAAPRRSGPTEPPAG